VYQHRALYIFAKCLLLARARERAPRARLYSCPVLLHCPDEDELPADAERISFGSRGITSRDHVARSRDREIARSRDRRESKRDGYRRRGIIELEQQLTLPLLVVLVDRLCARARALALALAVSR
jgi:hypothetical protein